MYCILRDHCADEGCKASDAGNPQLWDFAELNYIAIFVAAIVRMAIAMIWYHSGVFGKVWMNEALGAQRVENYNLKVFYAFLTTLVAATVLAGFISHAGDVSRWDGA